MKTSSPMWRLAPLAFGAAALACSDSDQPLIPPDPDSFVVQAYVYAGEPIDQVYVTGVLPIDAEEGDSAPPISDAAITILRGPDRFDLVPMSGEPGRYHFEGDPAIRVGDELNLLVSFDGREASAVTTVPPAPDGLELSSDELDAFDPFSEFGGVEELLGRNVVVRWANPAALLHFVAIDNLEVDPTILPTTEIVAEVLPRIITEPTPFDSTVVQQILLTHFGTHRVRLYRVNDEYAELYQGLTQDSRNLSEPPSNIDGALGIFSAFASDSAFFSVR